MSDKGVNIADKRRITAEDLTGLKFVGDPRLSPDGKNVVFTLTTMDLEKNGYRTVLWMVSQDGSAPGRQITGSGFDDRLVKDTSPRWSRDGASIAFLSNSSGNNQAWVLPMDGGEARRVTRLQDAASDIAWSPDSRAITYVSRAPAAGDAPKNKDVRVITRLRYKSDGVGFLDPRPKHIWVAARRGRSPLPHGAGRAVVCRSQAARECRSRVRTLCRRKSRDVRVGQAGEQA